MPRYTKLKLIDIIQQQQKYYPHNIKQSTLLSYIHYGIVQYIKMGCNQSTGISKPPSSKPNLNNNNNNNDNKNIMQQQQDKQKSKQKSKQNGNGNGKVRIKRKISQFVSLGVDSQTVQFMYHSNNKGDNKDKDSKKKDIGTDRNNDKLRYATNTHIQANPQIVHPAQQAKHNTNTTTFDNITMKKTKKMQPNPTPRQNITNPIQRHPLQTNPNIQVPVHTHTNISIQQSMININIQSQLDSNNNIIPRQDTTYRFTSSDIIITQQQQQQQYDQTENNDNNNANNNNTMLYSTIIRKKSQINDKLNINTAK